MTEHESEFLQSWYMVQHGIHETAKEKGWWDLPRSEGEVIALIHSELSECLEAMRHGDPADKHVPQFGSIVVELADTVIRIMDYAESQGLKLPEAILAKAAFNATREVKHGGKKF